MRLKKAALYAPFIATETGVMLYSSGKKIIPGKIPERNRERLSVAILKKGVWDYLLRITTVFFDFFCGGVILMREE